MFMILQVGTPLLLLSEKSIENDGQPQDIPDFTKGSWKSRKPVFGISSEF